MLEYCNFYSIRVDTNYIVDEHLYHLNFDSGIFEITNFQPNGSMIKVTSSPNNL